MELFSEISHIHERVQTKGFPTSKQHLEEILFLAKFSVHHQITYVVGSHD